MIFGKIKTVTTMKFYDEHGRFIGEGASYKYKATLTWFDVITGLGAAFFIFTQTYDYIL